MSSSPPEMSATPDRAMVLAAGLGTRMRPLTDARPKPLVEVEGRALIDHVLERLEQAHIRHVVVNLHYRADMLEAHLRALPGFDIRFSDERRALLDTGGGIRQALPLLGAQPFFVLNTDSIWAGAPASPLGLLARQWRDRDMDCLLLLARREGAIGYDGAGDFDLMDDGRVRRRGEAPLAAYAHTGTCLIHPRLFQDCPEGAFSLNLLWDRALTSGRLYAAVLEGQWMHIGDPGAVGAAEAWLKANGQ